MLIKNAKIATPEGVIQGEILIQEGRIAAVGRSIKGRGEEKLNLMGKLVIPGIVDMHVHMRDFTERHKEDLTTGSRAALAGGVTTFFEMPNTRPEITSVSTYERRLALASRKSLVDFGIYFGVTSENLEELKRASPRACKLYLDGTLGSVDYTTVEEALKVVSFLAVHAEDSATITRNLKKLRGVGNDFTVHCKLRSPEAESIAVKRVVEIASKLGRRVHICHLSTRKALNHLNHFATCEVTPHHLLLTSRALAEKGSYAKTNPPLRSASDVAALWSALKKGRVTCIASDHAPHSLADKKGNVLEAASGIPNLETMLPLLLTMVNRGRLSVGELIKLCCEAPAKLLGLENKGAIIAGKDADLVVIDMHRESVVNPEDFHSKAKYSPFEGWRLRGGVEMTILRGEIAYQDEDFLVRPGYGKPAL
ncbi:dihydroorotase [Candidatus Pyrohabitans sp.]